MRHGPLTHRQHVEISVLGVKVAQKVRASHARLSGACGCVSGREGPETERNGTNGVKLNVLKLNGVKLNGVKLSSSDGWCTKTFLSLSL